MLLKALFEIKTRHAYQRVMSSLAFLAYIFKETAVSQIYKIYIFFLNYSFKLKEYKNKPTIVKLLEETPFTPYSLEGQSDTVGKLPALIPKKKLIRSYKNTTWSFYLSKKKKKKRKT